MSVRCPLVYRLRFKGQGLIGLLFTVYRLLFDFCLLFGSYLEEGWKELGRNLEGTWKELGRRLEEGWKKVGRRLSSKFKVQSVTPRCLFLASLDDYVTQIAQITQILFIQFRDWDFLYLVGDGLVEAGAVPSANMFSVISRLVMLSRKFCLVNPLCFLY